MVRLSTVSTFWLDESPSVGVSGAWLSEFGFTAGVKVVIEVTQGQMVIKVVEHED